MKKHFRWLAVLLAIVLVAAACGSDDDDSSDSASDDSADTSDDSGSDDSGSDDSGDDDSDDAGDDAGTDDDGGEAVDQTQGGDLTFHIITHSDDGPFWSVVKRGVDAAGEDLGVTVVWKPGVNDANVMVQDIEAAVSEGTNGIGASLPDPAALVGPLQDAVGNGIPVITLNSGSNDYQDIGALTHVGQTEFVAGQGAGLRLNDAARL